MQRNKLLSPQEKRVSEPAAYHCVFTFCSRVTLMLEEDRSLQGAVLHRLSLPGPTAQNQNLFSVKTSSKTSHYSGAKKSLPAWKVSLMILLNSICIVWNHNTHHLKALLHGMVETFKFYRETRQFPQRTTNIVVDCGKNPWFIHAVRTSLRTTQSCHATGVYHWCVSSGHDPQTHSWCITLNFHFTGEKKWIPAEIWHHMTWSNYFGWFHRWKKVH